MEQETTAAAEPQAGIWLPGKGVEQPGEEVQLPGQELRLHTGTPDMMERDLPVSPASMWSSPPTADRPDFTVEEARPPSPVFSMFSMKSDVSMDLPLHFRSSSTANPVLCDVSGCPYPAVKSCVTCGDSYCRTCITPHYTDPQLGRHQLQDIQQQDLCTDHQKKLKFFCTTDQTAICSVCLHHRHKGHDAIEQVAKGKKGAPSPPLSTVSILPPPGQLQFTKVSPDSVTLQWSPPEGAHGPHRYAVTWRQGQDQWRTFTSPSCQVEVPELHPGQKHQFRVATLSQDGRQSTPVEGSIHTEIPVPEGLAVSSITASSARISWQVPPEIQKTAHSFLVSYQSEGTEPKSISTESCSTDITGLTPGTDYTVRVYTELQHGGKSQPAFVQMRTGFPLSELLSALGLRDLQGGKLPLSSVLEINSNTLSNSPP